jgi:hypothetical protein
MSQWARWTQQFSFLLTDVIQILKVVLIVSLPIAAVAGLVALVLVWWSKRPLKQGQIIANSPDEPKR